MAFLKPNKQETQFTFILPVEANQAEMYGVNLKKIASLLTISEIMQLAVAVEKMSKNPLLKSIVMAKIKEL